MAMHNFACFFGNLYPNHLVNYTWKELDYKNCHFPHHKSKLVSEQVIKRHKEKSPSPSANVSRHSNIMRNHVSTAIKSTE